MKFIDNLNKDKSDLANQVLSQKFSILVQILNNEAFGGKGSITVINNREFNLYEDGQNQIILFGYSTGNLTIVWKYKYFQKEVVCNKKFDNVRNISIFEQEKMANYMISEMRLIIENHQIAVLSSSGDVFSRNFPGLE